MVRLVIFAALVLWGATTFARAGDAVRCIDSSIPQKAAAANPDGQWIVLTADQWQFLRGIYAMNPSTPPGLPYGDRAALVRIKGHDSGLVFFIDGDRACTPMEAPKALLALLDDVATGKVAHDGDGM